MNFHFGFLKMKYKKPLRSDLYEKKSLIGGYIENRNRKWKRKEQAVFLLRLGELLSSGYHLADALRFIQSQEKKQRKTAITEAITLLKEGRTLYDVLIGLGFHMQLIQFVFYAEYYGDLARALKEGGEFWRKRNEDREKLMKILVYPSMLVMFVIGIALVLQGMLLPKFESLYSNMNMAPSPFMKGILFLSDMSSFFPLLLLTLLCLYFLFKKMYYLRLNQLQRKGFLLKIPVIGKYIRLFDTYYYTNQLSGVLAGGLSINDAIKLFIKHNQQPFVQSLSEQMYNELNEGKSLEDIFQQLPYFESYLVDIVANGQKNGKLDQELYHYSRIILQTMEEKMMRMIKLIQPLLFGLVGSIVVAIYLSVLLPMFSIMEGL